MAVGELLLVAGALLSAGLLASQLAGRVRVPALVLFLGLGMAIGSDGIGWIEFDDYDLAQSVGVVALALILFEGGLSAGPDEIRPVLGPAISLAVVGTIATAAITGFAAAWVLDLSLLHGLLIGAILASTDGAAIFALLRTSTLRRRLARTLEAEAGFNDPVAVLLVIALIEAITDPGYGFLDAGLDLVVELGVGAAAGLVVGVLAVVGLRRVRLATAGLYPVASLAIMGLAFGSADVLHGSGFLAVYLAGVVLGGSHVQALRTMATFHDGLAWVAQLAMFLALGLLVFPSQLDNVVFEGTAVALVLMLVARPAAAVIATTGFGFALRERVALGWAGLRGAVPVVLATFPVLADVDGALDIFNIVFFAVLLSTLLQGSTFEALANRLGVTTQEAALPSPLIEPATIRRLGAEVIEFPVREGDAAAGRRVRELELPREALLNLIVRGDGAIPPRGSTQVRPGDRLHVIVRQEAAVEFRELLERWRDGPLGPPPARRRVPRTAPAVSTVRPWSEADGDASHPDKVTGIPVLEQIRTRRDVPGAVVRLEDGRAAITGPIAAVGSPQQLTDFARRRLAGTDDDADRAWWREVVGALARE